MSVRGPLENVFRGSGFAQLAKSNQKHKEPKRGSDQRRRRRIFEKCWGAGPKVGLLDWAEGSANDVLVGKRGIVLNITNLNFNQITVRSNY